MSARRIDVHHHYLTDDLLDELGRLGIHHVGGQPLGPSRFEDSIRVMDRHEIDAALLSVPIPLTFEDAATSRRVARALNESGARAVAAYPGRVAGSPARWPDSNAIAASTTTIAAPSRPTTRAAFSRVSPRPSA